MNAVSIYFRSLHVGVARGSIKHVRLVTHKTDESVRPYAFGSQKEQYYLAGKLTNEPENRD